VTRSEPSPAAHLGDLDTETFLVQAHRAMDWIARYLTGAEAYPVLTRMRPGELTAALPPAPPEKAEPLSQILDDVLQQIVPGLTHWNHPGFFAYFANSSTAPAILAEALAAALNANAMLWKTAPAATELEIVALDWLRQLLGLPAGLFGVIQDTASTATLLALMAAREAVPGLEVRRQGLRGQARLRMYASEHAHSSVEKAGIVLGIGQEGFRTIPVDERYRMDVEALSRAVAEDRASGWLPFAVTATVGTTSTTSIDPVADVAEVCRREGLWLHVDAAYAGCAAVVPELRHILDGCQHADSFVANPHKWLFVPVDLSVLYTRRPDVLRSALSLVPEYLRTPEEAVAPNLMDYGVALGRRFRALKLWMVLRAFGSSGIAARIREHVRLAQLFRSWVAEEPVFELAAPSPLSVVCFRVRVPGQPPEEADRRNEALMNAVNATGEIYLSHTKLEGRITLRLAVGNIRTEERHVRRAWELLREQAAALR
jgi:aromatic-L-amino-acid decarboxylase